MLHSIRPAWPLMFALTLVSFPMTIVAYELDADLRKSLSKSLKRELVEETPRAQRLSVRLSFSTKGAFRDYERIAKRAGYPPYSDCSIATFVEITNWQIIQGKDATATEIAALVKRCEATDLTVLGPKPVSQKIGDREILRGMWQRNLAFVGKGLGDNALQEFVTRTAIDRFFNLYGNPAKWQITDNGFEPIPEAATASTVTPEESSSTATTTASKLPSTTPETSTASSSTVSTTSVNGIDRIALRTVTGYGLSGVYVTNKTYLMLKDGTIHRSFSDNPYTIDINASRRESPDDWGRWRKRGSALQVTWPGDEPDLWENWFTTRPAVDGQTISGRFQSADPFGGGRVANFNTVAFDANGRFSWASLKGGDTGAWLPAYSDTRRAGRYKLDRYSIRLTYNDGTIEHYAFCFYPKDFEHFVIGANHFTPLD
ncbi:MAG: hypothetical protein AAF290_16780 [Pseudomonadota bacterium]